MKKNESQKTVFGIPEKRIPLYAAAAAGMVLILTLLIVLPPLLRGEEAKPTGLRNPVQTDIADSGDSLRASGGTDAGNALIPTDGAYVLSPADSTSDSTALYAYPTDAALRLTTTEEITAEELQKTVTVTPAEEVVIAASDDGFLITPAAGSWSADTLYRVSFGEGETPAYVCAFQTARAFAVDSVYPAHEMTEVPTDTGIEITFTDPVRNADLASFITVSPVFDGRIELYPNGRTAVIIPDEPLEARTQYTVSVRAGLPSDNGTTLTEGRIFGFYTAAGTTEEQASSLHFSVDDQTLVSPGDEAAISYNTYINSRSDISTSQISVTAEVYAFASADAASAAILKGAAARGAGAVSGAAGMLPTDGLTMVWSGDADKVAVDSWSRGENGWIYLPVLDEGVYIVSFTASADSAVTELETTAQTLLQVTPLRAFTESVSDPDNGTKTLIWAHRTDDGAPAVGSSITATLFENTVWRTQEQIDSGDDMAAFHSVTAQTDENGIAEFTSVMENADAALLHLRHVDKSLLLCAPLSQGTGTAICRYYVYTDRAVYFPDDTVRFWGVLGRAYANQPLPEVLSLSVAGNDTGIRVTVAEDGSFSGSFPIEDWTSSIISFGLTDEDGTVNYYSTLRVTQQDKPLYQLDISYDRPFYTLDEPTANVTMTVSYFDGTPAAGITLHVSAQTSETLTTDENGTAVYTYTMPDPYVDSTAPQYSQLSVQISGYETATLYRYDYTYYYHSGGVFSSQRLDNDRSRVTLHALDTSALTTREDVYSLNGSYPDNVRGTPMDTSLSVVLKKTYYVKTKSDSTEYDPINRVTFNRYYYEQKQEIVDSFTAQTVNGELFLDHIDTAGQQCSYTYIVTWHDPVSGRDYTEYIHANRGTRDYSPYSEGVYRLTGNTDAALIGESVDLQLTLGDDAFVIEDGAPMYVLFSRYTNRGGRVDTAVGKSTAYSYTFDEDCTAGCIVYAVIFDGESYETNPAYTVSYDYERGSTAEITVSADRDTYKPGEDAVITVSAPELAGGTVLVSVVDEACFALGENESEPGYYFRFGSRWGSPYLLPSVNRSVDGISLLSLLRAGGEFWSMAVEDEAVAEEAAPTTGSGDNLSDSNPDYVREEFLDNAAFVSLTLDKNGQAQTRIRVPDNITTWRLTAIGFTGTGKTADSGKHTSGVRCGIGVGNTVCTLPFFLNVTLPDLFLTQDEISFSARAAGTARALDPTAPVQYRAQLLDEAFAEIASGDVTAAANDTAWFHFDALPAGEYTVQVSGVLASGEQDAIRLTFRVAETAQIVDTRKTLSPGELSALSPAAYPLTLSFYDGTDLLYYDTLDMLSCLGTRRTDAMAAAYAALTADVDGGDVWYGEDSRERAAKIRAELSDSYWGFLPLNQYAEGDCILTAEILYASPDALTAARKTQLIPFFEEVLSDSDAAEEEVAASLMALASLGEPVLDRLYNTAQYAANASTAAKLYLSAGFAAAGDFGAAETLWNSVKASLGRTMQGDAFCISDASTEEAIRLTALGLLPASVLDPDTACGMVRYLSNHTSSVDLHVLELAAFITHYTPTAAGETAFTFGLRDSDPITVTLRRGQRYSISLTKSDFEAFSILSADDGILVRAAYGAAPEDAKMTADEVLTLRKTVEPYDAKNGIYRVTVYFSGVTDANHMYFSLSDTIPAGARYFAMDRSSTYANMCSAYLYNTGGQQMKGSVIVYNPTLYDKNALAGTQQYEISGAISYYIRGAVKGTFLAEPALALNYENGTYAQSNALEITIADGGWTVAESVSWELAQAFAAAEKTAAALIGCAGNVCTAESVTLGNNGDQYSRYALCGTMAELHEMTSACFDDALTDAFLSRTVVGTNASPLFAEQDGVLYQYSGYVALWSYDCADAAVTDWELQPDGSIRVTVAADMSPDGETTYSVTHDYTCVRGDDGRLRFTGAFPLPVNLLQQTMNT